MNTAVLNGRQKNSNGLENAAQTINVTVVDAPLSCRQAERLESLSPSIRLWREPTAEALRNAQVLYSEPRGIIGLSPNDVPNLGLVQLNTVACDGVDTCELAGAGIPFANVRGAYTPAVAEFTIGLMLSLMRRLERCRDLQNRGVWTQDVSTLGGQNCYGKTLGILGYGSIGRQIARVAAAMGMQILACKRRPEERDDKSFALPGSGDAAGLLPAAWYGIDELQDFFSQCDAVVLTLPRTPATLNLVGPSELKALPSGAVVINIGRGGILDELALAEMLHQKQLAGAALDVAATEPLPIGHPLWNAPNLLLTPHIASYTHDQAELASEVLIENVRRHLNREALLNLVSLADGY